MDEPVTSSVPAVEASEAAGKPVETKISSNEPSDSSAIVVTDPDNTDENLNEPSVREILGTINNAISKLADSMGNMWPRIREIEKAECKLPKKV